MALKSKKPLNKNRVLKNKQAKKPIGGSSKTRDIAGRKRPEVALRESEEKFRNLFNNAEVGMFRTRLDGSMFLDLNDKYLSILGRTREEMIGNPSTNFWADPHEREEMVTMVKAKGHVDNLEFRLMRKDGKVINCVTSVKLYPEQGILEGSIIDITGLKQAEKALRESEEKYRSLVDGANEAILVAQDGMLRFVNHKAAELSGYPEPELLAKPFPEFIYPDDRKMVVDNYVRRIKGEPVRSRYEFRLLTADNSAKWVEINTILMDWNGKPATLNFLTDITERKQAEGALRESEERFKRLFEESPSGIALVDTEGIMLEANRSLLTMLGISREDLVGKNFVALAAKFGMDIQDQIADFRERHTGGTAMKEMMFPNLRGEQITITVQSSTIMSGGRAAGILYIVNDITEQKKAEEELKFRNLILSTQQEVSIDGILVVDDTAKIISCNQRFIDMWAVPPDVIKSKSSDRVLQSVMDKVSNPEEFINRVKNLYSHHPETSRDEIALKDGRSLDRYSAPMFGSNGKYYGRVWYFRDITDRKNAIRVLEVQARMLDSATDSIILHDKDGNIKYTNEAASRHFGYSPVDLMNMNLAALNTPESVKRMGPRLKAVMEKGKDMFEVEHLRKDGSVRPAEVNARVFTRGDEKLILSVVRDITDRKNAEKEKEKLLSQLLQAQKMEAIGTLAGGVAHDFNNLLTAISGYTNLAMGKIDEYNPMHRDLKQVSLAAAKAAGVVRQLLLFSRKQHIEPVPMDPNATIIRLLKMLDRIIGEDIVIKIDIQKDIWNILGDEGNIEQVLMNLAVNAKDAMPSGGKLSIKTENVTIDQEYCRTYNAARPGRFVCLSISDTGTGMDELTQGHIFEPFFTTKEVGKGTGLGLSVVLGIVQQHKGWINVSSEPGHGTTFKVYFPSTSDRPGQLSNKDAPLASLHGKGERIMVVEDHAEVRAIAVEMLTINEYSVFPVSSAKEAKDLFEKENGNFDLVFCDVVLTDSAGTLLVEELLKRRKFGVLITSGYTDEKSHWDFIKENKYRFLPKPYTMQGLLQAVREVLEEKK